MADGAIDGDGSLLLLLPATNDGMFCWCFCLGAAMASAMDATLTLCTPCRWPCRLPHSQHLAKYSVTTAWCPLADPGHKQK